MLYDAATTSNPRRACRIIHHSRTGGPCYISYFCRSRLEVTKRSWIQEITLPEGFGKADTVLVDGGRWFLALSELQVHYGCVLAYDLDAPVIQEPAFIIRPQDAWDSQRAFFMAVDVDKNEPILTFNVSIIPEKI